MPQDGGERGKGDDGGDWGERCQLRPLRETVAVSKALLDLHESRLLRSSVPEGGLEAAQEDVRATAASSSGRRDV